MAVAVAAGFDEEPPRMPKDIVDLLTRAVQGDEEATMLLPDRIYGCILKSFGEGRLTMPAPGREHLLWCLGARHLAAEEQDYLFSVCMDILRQMFGQADDSLRQKLVMALGRLAVREPRLAQVVELRFLRGLTEEAIAERLNVSVRTVKRDWHHAKALLYADS